MITRTGVTLAELTTIRLGGPAESFVAAETAQEVADAVRDAAAEDVPLLVLAGGSNLLVSDDGFPGRVLAIRTTGVDVEREGGGTVRVTAAAGEVWDTFVRRCVAEGWSGVECLAGIPGAVGSTPIQNVGAYGQDVSATLVSVTVLDRASGEVATMAAAECGLGYRTSRFKYHDDLIVLDVTFRLRQRAESEPVRYAELARTLGVSPGDSAPLAQVSEAVVGLRRGKGMVVDPADPDTNSCGSFFTNPVVDGATVAAVERAAPQGVDVPQWPDKAGRVKLSAAWLIQRSGFDRGYGHGDARISSKHTLALTNRGSATAADVLALAREVRAGVRDRFGVLLHPEPVLVGVSLDEG